MKKKGKLFFKLSYKIMIAMFTITIIPLSILSFAINSKTKDFYNHNLHNLYKQISNQYVNNLIYKYNNYQNMCASVITLSRVRELIEDGNDDSPNIYKDATSLSNVIQLVSLEYNNENEMKNMMIYSLKDQLAIYTTKVVTYKDSLNFDILCNENIQKGYSFYRNSMGVPILSLISPILSQDISECDIMAYIVLDLDADKFFSVSQSIYDAYGTDIIITVTDKNNNEIYSNKANKKVDDSMHTFTVDYPNFLKKYGFNVSIKFLSNKVDIYGSYQITLVLITIVLFLIAMISSAMFSKSLEGRIKVLIKKMDHVIEGDMTIYEVMKGSDELTEIDEHFNKMVKKLNTYINENFLQKIAYKKAQLNILQNQINPHFLYNTLEIIDSMASRKGIFEISDVCYKLGQIFRYNVSKNSKEYVPFLDEINHVKNYTAIQQLRFSSRLNIEFDINPDCEKVTILKFILQPLVENAIVHALESKDTGGLLQLSAKMQDRYLKIDITDNGSGFNEQTLKELNHFIKADIDINHIDFSGGIGLKNVITRIKLVYGENAAISITSKLSKGSVITLLLPDINDL